MVADTGRRLALIVGNSQYQDQTLRQLTTPGQDAEALARVLADARIGGFEITALINRLASEILREIEGFFADRKRDDLLLVYFSGHGIKDDAGRLFLAAQDTRRNRLRATAIPASFLHGVMEDSRSRRQVLILDCCHSGAFPEGMTHKGAETAGIDEQFKGGRGRVILTASNAIQYAFEGGTVKSVGQSQQSVFTRYLVRGLETGEADRDRDSLISLVELYDYVHDRVKDETPQQTPMIWQFGVEGDIVIARNPHPPPPATPPVTPDEVSELALRRRIQALWTDALEFFYTDEWAKARDTLKRVMELQPNFRDVADKLNEAERQCALAESYEKATSTEAAGRWEEAITHYTRVIELDAGYRDAAAKLAQAKEQLSLAQLYDDARALARDERWDSVLGVFAKIDARRPKYPDPDGLRAKAEAERRNARLAAMYAEGLEAIDRREWKKAIQNFEALEREQRDYRQTRFHLAKAREQLAAAGRAPLKFEPVTSSTLPIVQRQTPELSRDRVEWSTLASILQRPIVRTIAALVVAAIACRWVAESETTEGLEELKKKLIYGETWRDLLPETVIRWALLISIPGLVVTLFKLPTRRSALALLVSGLAFAIGIYVFALGFAGDFAKADEFEYAAIIEQARILFLGGWLGSIWGLAVALTLFGATRRRSLLLLPFGIVSVTATTFLSLSPFVYPEIPNLGVEGAVMGWAVWGVAAAGMLMWVNSQKVHQ